MCVLVCVYVCVCVCVRACVRACVVFGQFSDTDLYFFGDLVHAYKHFSLAFCWCVNYSSGDSSLFCVFVCLVVVILRGYGFD